MYEDDGCIDGFDEMSRHFTPPDAGGWDRRFCSLVPNPNSRRVEYDHCACRSNPKLTSFPIERRTYIIRGNSEPTGRKITWELSYC